MKKIFLGIVLSLALVGTAYAITSGPNGGAAQVSTFASSWESLGVAAGAVITSPVLRTDFSTECVVVADNSAGGSSRTLNLQWIGSDGTTVLYQQAVTVTNGTRAIAQIGGQSSAAATLLTGITVMPVGIGRRMLFQLASAGAAAGSLAVYCR